MTEKRTKYGFAALTIALMIIGGTVSTYFYYQYSNEKSVNSGLVSELNRANQNYSGLASSFNSLLSKYNESLSLLSRSVGVLNTSTPLYAEASKELGNLWREYLALKPIPADLLHASMLIDFGNGSRLWFNHTAVQPGWNAFVATVVLLNGSIEATWYPQFGEHFVSGVDGVSGTQSNSWFVWAYGPNGWELSPTGSDQLEVYDGTVFGWTLCGYDQSFSPTCSP